jgi:hypothetical protein
VEKLTSNQQLNYIGRAVAQYIRSIILTPQAMRPSWLAVPCSGLNKRNQKGCLLNQSAGNVSERTNTRPEYGGVR